MGFGISFLDFLLLNFFVVYIIALNSFIARLVLSLFLLLHAFHLLLHFLHFALGHARHLKYRQYKPEYKPADEYNYYSR